MNYIVKDESNKLMIMTAPGHVPVIPGLEVLGLASELNPDSLDLDLLSWDGESLIEDQAKIDAFSQANAEANLNTIRALREPLLTEADHEINKLEDDAQDASAWRVYRKALRECTEALKEENGQAKLECEAIDPEEFEFPVKP